jgi:myo-inositol 2-dehydrogenase/D-chiro-inositol 1-dehydrogenase
MRVGLVGYGAWGRMHADAIVRIPGLDLAGIVAQGEASVRAAASRHAGVPVHRRLGDLLADPSVELVDIVVPNHLHAEMALAALASGKHVLLEKPLATSLAEAERVITAAELSGLYLGVGHELRVSKQWSRVKALIDEDAIGTPRHAVLSLFRRPFRPGSGGWRYDSARVGSWILEEPVHYIDLLLWYFARCGDPVELEAFAVPSAAGERMHDAFTVVLRFADGGYAVFSQCLGGFEHALTLELIGNAGAIRTWWAGAMDRTVDPSFALKLQRCGATEPEAVAVERSGEVFELEEQLRRLIDDVPRRTPLVSAREALRAVTVCLAAERALAERRPVRLALV